MFSVPSRSALDVGALILIAENLSAKRVGPVRAVLADAGRDRPPARLTACRTCRPRPEPGELSNSGPAVS